MTIELKIGKLAKATGTTAPTIRYYEEIGLLPAAPRQSGSQRVYGEADIRRLTFIRRCRDFGFSIERVRVLVSLVQSPGGSCVEARDIAQSHLDEVREKLSELRELDRSISAFVRACDRTGADAAGSECAMLEELSDRGRCRQGP